jgi:hypothetical protein
MAVTALIHQIGFFYFPFIMRRDRCLVLLTIDVTHRLVTLFLGSFLFFSLTDTKDQKSTPRSPLHPHRATFPARDPSSPTITSNHAPGDISCGIQTNDNSNAATAYLSNSAASFVT